MSSSLNIKVWPTPIQDVLLIDPIYLGDERGWLVESFNAKNFASATGLKVEFVQDNHSFSTQWTLRGLHYQLQQTQGKLVHATAGVVFDVIVDVRKESPTYGRWLGTELSAENQRQIWVPAGLAHGFLVLSKSAEILYKTTDYYHPQSEVCLAWNDSQVNIEWPLPPGIMPIMSAKDSAGLSWDAAPKF